LLLGKKISKGFFNPIWRKTCWRPKPLESDDVVR